MTKVRIARINERQHGNYMSLNETNIYIQSKKQGVSMEWLNVILVIDSHNLVYE